VWIADVEADMSKYSNAGKEGLADLAVSIADQLRPWRKDLERTQVLDEIRSAIEQLNATNFDVGSRKDNKEYAETGSGHT
jgi:hypothetical protein